MHIFEHLNWGCVFQLQELEQIKLIRYSQFHIFASPRPGPGPGPLPVGVEVAMLRGVEDSIA